MVSTTTRSAFLRATAPAPDRTAIVRAMAADARDHGVDADPERVAQQIQALTPELRQLRTAVQSAFQNGAPHVAEPGERRCPQCWQHRPWPEAFLGKRGRPVQWCQSCQARYRSWDQKTLTERQALPRHGVPTTTTLRARLYLRSGNKKLGGIPSSITSRGTCPTSCTFKSSGCYAEYHILAHHWRRVGTRGDTWQDFLGDVAALPDGQLWRHNEAGDLPGDGDALDVHKLGELVDASAHARGFTFTHKPLHTAEERAAIERANERGFTVNLSADTLEDADRLAGLGVAPVAVVLPFDAPDRSRTTPAGRRVTVCPAQTHAMTCADCRLCAHPTRAAIVGFRAHGQAARLVTSLVKRTA